MEYEGTKTIIGRLLSEVSWAGRTIKDYREGGAGYENVLTAEVFQLLDFLPRTEFLMEVLKSVHMQNEYKYSISSTEVEAMNLDILPGNYYLKKEYTSHQTGMPVQPDGLLESNKKYIMLEAKRIKRSSFQKRQLAKEFYLMTREMKDREPLLFVVLGKEPPVSIAGKGRRSLVEDILIELDGVHKEAKNHPLSLYEIKELVNQSVGWITWTEILSICNNQLSKLKYCNESMRNSVKRMIVELEKIIDRHS